MNSTLFLVKSFTCFWFFHLKFWNFRFHEQIAMPDCLEYERSCVSWICWWNAPVAICWSSTLNWKLFYNINVCHFIINVCYHFIKMHHESNEVRKGFVCRCSSCSRFLFCPSFFQLQKYDSSVPHLWLSYGQRVAFSYWLLFSFSRSLIGVFFLAFIDYCADHAHVWFSAAESFS